VANFVHPRAHLEGEIELEEEVYIGPGCILEGKIKIGRGTRLIGNVYISGDTTIGRHNTFYPGCSIGAVPQDLHYDGAHTYTIIGDNNIFRENVTVHRGVPEESATVIGNQCLLMVGAHVGHNSRLGDRVIMANNATIGGHVTVGDRAFLSAQTAVHQFCRIGEVVILAGLSGAMQDIPPFMMAAGRSAIIVGINTVGLQRAGCPPEERSKIKRAYRILYRQERALHDAVATIEAELGGSPYIQKLLSFLRAESKRGILTGQVTQLTEQFE